MCRSPTWFKCENGKCISHVFVADDNNDCGDWSDEDYKHEYQHQVNWICFYIAPIGLNF